MHETGNIGLDKSFAFAVRMVKLSRYLKEEFREYEIAGQLIRSGTSIGANLHEGVRGITGPDMLSKFYNALKEANETHFWLKLLHACDCLTDAEYQSVNEDCEELLRIIGASTTTLRQNNAKRGKRK